MCNNIKTKICCLNMEDEVCEFLSNNFDVYNGSLGGLVDVSKHLSKYNTVYLLPNNNFPKNLHEYGIIVCDLNNIKIVDYIPEEHERKVIVEGYDAEYFVVEYPETHFNPIPYNVGVLHHEMRYNSRQIINIVFQSQKESITYNIYNEKKNSKSPYYNSNNYSFTINFADVSLYGKEIIMCDNDISKKLFSNFIHELEYHQTFFYPKKLPLSCSFVPLLQNKQGKIISYVYKSEHEVTIILPQMKSKKEFLKILFNDYLYKEYSECFPFIKQCSWKNQECYYLPGHKSLEEKKKEIVSKYEREISEIDIRIEDNKIEHQFLHDILTESGDLLVAAVIKYFKWLGFEDVTDKDKILENGVYEEDIRIDLGEKGLLIVEVKGLFGTSKDHECAQISKIRYRRCEEREKFDVYALYIVNNERNVEPLKRTLPPFNQNQINDAKNDKRGMIYTWQLFNLYFNIEEGFITKDEVRNRLLEIGLIDLSPTLIDIGEPYKYYQNNTVACVELNDTEISCGDILAYERDGRYYKVKILEIQMDNKSVERVSNGRVGIKFNVSLPNGIRLYKV